MENKGRHARRAILLAVAAVSLMPVGRAYCQSAQHRTQQAGMKELVEKTEAGWTEDSDEPEGYGASDPSYPGIPDAGHDGGRGRDEENVLRRYAALYEKNSELAGWLSIEGMDIDYPVMQCEDDEYYLHHDFYGEDSKYGCLYVREQADLDNGTNFIIYGHNMKDGAMFGDLDLYADEEFFREHPTVSFDTLYERRTYAVIAVFRSQVYHADDDVFKYYQFYEAKTQEEFDDFYGNIKELSLYDTGVGAEFGDTFLTMSTCAYHVPDGRFVVVAKRTK